MTARPRRKLRFNGKPLFVNPNLKMRATANSMVWKGLCKKSYTNLEISGYESAIRCESC